MGHRSMRQVPELLPDPLVEARALYLGEAADALVKGDLGLVARRKRAELLAVDRDVDRLAAGCVSDSQDVVGGDHQRPGVERVRRYVADDIPLHAPGENRPAVREVVSG